MSSFKIEGGNLLGGTIVPQGAKNEALEVICATLLTQQRVTIRNIPEILDVKNLIALVGKIGVTVEKAGEGVYSFEAREVDISFLATQEYNRLATSLRGSIMILGPLLARFHKIQISLPGGDKIGRRRLDTHFLGFHKLGASYHFDPVSRLFTIDSPGLSGSNMLLDEASVTGTANIIMAAVLAEGETTIYNAACEPYIQQLCKMLNKMGANITGIGSNLLRITGVRELSGTDHTLLPDMIEVGSFIGLAAMTQSEITIKDASVENLGIIPDVYKRLGINLTIKGNDICIPAQQHYEIETFIDGSIMTVSDAIWPGFSPDLLSIALVVATQAKGTVLIHQKMFESRLFFVDKLIDMGAQIILCDPHRATVIGLDRKFQLRGIKMSSPDIRAGVALLIAALSAEGTSIISNVEQIDRGYQDIDKRLASLGARIERLEE